MDIKEIAIKYKNYLFGVGILIIFLLLGINKNDNKSDEDKYLFSTSDSESSVSTKEISVESYFVEITGQVIYPGVYELDKDYILLELIELAGGTTDMADIEYLHKTLGLSTVVKPEQKVFIPVKNNNSSISNTTTDGLVSINNSSIEQLMTLSGIGEVTARSIIENRPYNTIEELKNVSGIGDATYGKIVSQIEL